MKVVSIVGARPNFVKMAPVAAELRRRLAKPDDHVLVHTGQHYDPLLSEIFVDELGFQAPDHMLGIGSGTHAVQTARVMERLEPVLLEEHPDLVIVPGDVNSTLAAALVAAKMQIPIAHVESGLRSFDRTMPEEINRILTDQIARDLFVHSEEATDNLLREGVEAERIHFVGNTMIDSLVSVRDRFEGLEVASRFGLQAGDYVLVTLHRPALVDGPLLPVVLEQLGELTRQFPVLLPAHPRTRRMIGERALPPGLILTDPVGYLEFLSLESDARAVLTDSGGVQEETTYLRVPCFTLRSTTERPVTISAGTNVLLGLEPERIGDLPEMLQSPVRKFRGPPPLWDGHAAERLVDVLTSERSAVLG